MLSEATRVTDETGVEFSLGPSISAGGQGEVYRVLNHPDYAIKLLTRPDDLERIRIVRRLPLGDLDLAAPITVIQQPKYAGYVMRLAQDMETLDATYIPPRCAQLLPQQDPTWYRESGGLRRRLAIASRIADAIAGLHARGLCYVDLNPKNVMASTDVKRDATWLIDADNLTSTSAPVWSIIGLKGYTAPERSAHHQAPPSTLADAYSLGVLVFRLLLMTHPLAGVGTENLDGESAEDYIDRGLLTYVDDPEDVSNRLPARSLASKLFPLALSGRLQRLSRQTFGPGRLDPRARPGAARWREVLHTALDNVVDCPDDCGWTYYRLTEKCPNCNARTAPSTLLTIYGRGYEQPGAARDTLVVNAHRPTDVMPRQLWGRYGEREAVLTLRPARNGFDLDPATDVTVRALNGKAVSWLRPPKPGEVARLVLSAPDRPDRELGLRFGLMR